MIGDEITVRVIGIRFELNDKYISVIAEHVIPRKARKRPKIIIKKSYQNLQKKNKKDEFKKPGILLNSF